MSDVKIDLRPDGPILITGPVTLNDFQGNSFDLGGKTTFALCRCGHTGNKPFCDGSHKTCGFQSRETAVPG